MSYVGKICPYCKSSITENDEVVICSDCEMPHHKECWIENRGCTTFGCNGTIQGAGQTMQGQGNPSITYCTTCGHPNESSSRFCLRCGTALVQRADAIHPAYREIQDGPQFSDGSYQPQYSNSYNQQNQGLGYQNNVYQGGSQYNNGYQNSSYQYNNPGSSYQNNTQQGSAYGGAGFQNNGYPGSGYQYGSYQNGYTDYQSNTNSNAYNEDVEAFVQNNTGYYINKFNKMQFSNSDAGWNWCSFFFAPYWFIYRKLYGIGAAIFGFTILTIFIRTSGDPGISSLLSLISLTIDILMGIFGNGIYKNTVRKEIGYANTMDPQQKQSYLYNKGGTNGGALAAVIVGYFILTLLISSWRYSL